MSGKRLTPRPFRQVIAVLLPLVAAALCAAQALPFAGNANRGVVRTGQSSAGIAASVQSVAANKAADAAAIVAEDSGSLFSKPSSPGPKAAAAVAEAVAVPRPHAEDDRRPVPDTGVRSAPPAHAYFPQAPPASLTLA